MKTFVLQKKDAASASPKESHSVKRRRKKPSRRTGPEPRCLFKDPPEDDEESGPGMDGLASEPENEDDDGSAAQEPSSPVPSFKEDDDVFSGKFGMPQGAPSPKRTPRRRRQSASSGKFSRQQSNKSSLAPTPSKETEAMDDVQVLAQDVDDRLVNLIPENLNP